MKKINFTKLTITTFNIQRHQVADKRDISLAVFNQESFDRFVSKVNNVGIANLTPILYEMYAENEKIYNQFAEFTYREFGGKTKTVYGSASDVKAFMATFDGVKLEHRSAYFKHTEADLMKWVNSFKSNYARPVPNLEMSIAV